MRKGEGHAFKPVPALCGSGESSRRAGFGFRWGPPSKASLPVSVQIRPTARGVLTTYTSALESQF